MLRALQKRLAVLLVASQFANAALAQATDASALEKDSAGSFESTDGLQEADSVKSTDKDSNQLSVTSDVVVSGEASHTGIEHTSINATHATNKKKNDDGCKVTSESSVWVDVVRADTHSRLCNTASWLDGLFGDEEDFQGEDFRGKISIGFKQDEIDGLDPRLRVRIRTKLPNVSRRFDAFLGRVEEDSYISNTEVNQDRVNNVGFRSTNDEDSEWLVGLGYRRPTEDSNGLDFSVGAKLSSGLSPYAKTAHRYLFPTSENSFWRTTQTVFWRKQDGFGVSSKAEYTRLIGDHDIWVSQGSVKYTEESEQWEWFAETTLHHSITRKRGISSSMYMRGEEENPISLPEYGLTFTYIRPIMRDWLSIETGIDFRWEQYEEDGPYKSAVTLGIQFEMQLGDYYQRRRHK